MKKRIVVGTRGSALALTQTHKVIDLLKQVHPELEVEVKVIKTTGDKILNKTLSKIGGKGLFVKEIEEALYLKEVDLAVHSMKDVPNTLPEGFVLGAILQREDPRDVLISKNYRNIGEMPKRALIGTSSLRRTMQLRKLNPHLRFEPLRGNIDSRIKRAESEEFDGIILAAAGLHRMGWQKRITTYLEIEECIPAVGQGALGIEIREKDEEMHSIVSVLHHEEDAKCVLAERAYLREMNGGCHIPIGAYARIENNELSIKGFIGAETGEELFRTEIRGGASEYKALGKNLAEKIRTAVEQSRVY